jgi:hypothetical protein
MSGRVYQGTTPRKSVPTTAAWVAYAPYVPLVVAAGTVAAQIVLGGRVREVTPAVR